MLSGDYFEIEEAKQNSMKFNTLGLIKIIP